MSHDEALALAKEQLAGDSLALHNGGSWFLRCDTLARSVISLHAEFEALRLTAEEREALGSLRFMIRKYWATDADGNWYETAMDALDRLLGNPAPSGGESG